MKNRIKMSVMLTMAFLLSLPFFAKAESTVYVFGIGHPMQAILKINGDSIGELQGHVKKVYDDPMFVQKTYAHVACVKKCVIKSEGKTVFSVNADYPVPTRYEIKHYYAEIQLNLTDGSVHYIEMKYKGIDDIQIKEISEKDALKKMKEKKRDTLEDYIEE